ncbi:MAG: hypothetical protein KME19_08985 [Microcoleus vaginatus WJT46-NPBG5]|jgi:hypothetical protein|nr:hypothetical protein [Microcoleus vaginatus WJT46-NPBG5]MBW4680235.1 hypothetical protein [Microcoleus vaginatus WJT46-NPBG5]
MDSLVNLQTILRERAELYRVNPALLTWRKAEESFPDDVKGLPLIHQLGRYTILGNYTFAGQSYVVYLRQPRQSVVIPRNA